MEYVAVPEAARLLGVSTRQVQHLAAAGELQVVARGLVDRTSVDRYLAARPASRRRAWSERTAWAAVALLSARPAPWLGAPQRSRLRTTLRGLTADELLGRTRDRARAGWYAGHSSAPTRLRRDVVDTSAGAVMLGLAEADRLNAYVVAADLDDVVSRHALVRAPGGRIVLRATTMDLGLVADLAGAGVVLSALDLAESLDPRERRVGLDALAGALGRFRG
ncbi:helix-turn-helix domain-containing protein [Nocardioides speluncae]|uniref:helix-turn-helix domain-containing protein n=1 Tax=Nocardioides speluncae TaxID=2670337 RepID=UPI000D69A5E0|nr:helix-turn-helix domain-containing protein [Nocardioides speluncae]